MDSPGTSPFSAYLNSNDPLPVRLYPALDQCITELSKSIENLSDPIALAAGDADSLDSSTAAHNQHAYLLDARRMHMATKSAVRRIPAEVLALIFAHVLGDRPFEEKDRLTFSHLRGVCNLWRKVAMNTPGLCSGLVLSLDHPPLTATADSAPQEAFSAAFRPWFELPRGSSDFELVLGSPRDSAHHAKEFLTVLLGSYISDVGKLTIRTEPILSSFLQFKRTHPQIQRLTLGVAGRSVDMDPKLFVDLETIFPSLQIFCMDGYSPLVIPPVHSNLQSFIFGGSALSCTALEVHRCLSGLPRLENLLLSCTQSIPRERLDPLPSEGILVHRNLKKLMLVGEQLLERFTFVALPSLQTLHITGWGMRMAHDVTRATTRLQSLIERSDLQHLDVRIDGVVSIPFLSNAINVLSIPSRLFVGFFGIRQGPQVLYPQDIEEFPGPKITIPANGLKEIICNENTGSLVWLSGGDQRSSPLDLHVPTNYLGQRKISVERISDCGLNLRIHPDSEIDAMFICDPRFEGHMVLG